MAWSAPPSFGFTLALWLVATGCVFDEADVATGDGLVQPPATAPGGKTDSLALSRCTGRSYTPAPKQSWKKKSSALIAIGRARHAGRDEIVAEGSSVTIRGKFAYGSISKDLEGETVRLYIDDCTKWKKVADLTTNSDGRVSLDLGVLPVGVYEVRFQVMGDQSLAPATIWVLPEGTHLSVFDIDGTLSTGDGELITEVFVDIFHGTYIPKAYPAAAELTLAHEAINYIPVYLTGRPYWLSFHTRRWLDEGDFAQAPVRLTETNGQSLPSESGVGNFKRGILEDLVESGFVLDLAYGNASTDIYAYLGAGIPASDTWIIGKNAGDEGTNAVTGSWAARVDQVEALPPVDQPFEQ